ncbi:DsbA family oxidoreductase [Halomicrococcus gelatinilyticus]|uniref:DsbA family oxidoreductase n=1 Tax=Halomicrococcus gelatinilyticus TaxID=1702103 RepID=UPI002E0DD106
MAEQSTADLVVYSDYVCPFSYLGKESLENYREERDDPLDVEWRVFDLRGYKRDDDGELRDVDDGKDDDYMAKVRENVEHLKAQFDAEMTVDFSVDADSWNANKATLFVRRNYDAETFRAFHDAVFEARWQAARDIGDPDVLADAAADAGVDPGEVRDAIADDALDADLEERFDAARDAGVTGVPTFVGDRNEASGALPPEQLDRLVE